METVDKKITVIYALYRTMHLSMTLMILDFKGHVSSWKLIEGQLIKAPLVYSKLH